MSLIDNSSYWEAIEVSEASHLTCKPDGEPEKPLYNSDPVTVSAPMTEEEIRRAEKVIFDAVYLPEAAKRLMRKLGYWEGME